jgi:hypothetical protein
LFEGVIIISIFHSRKETKKKTKKKIKIKYEKQKILIYDNELVKTALEN